MHQRTPRESKGSQLLKERVGLGRGALKEAGDKMGVSRSAVSLWVRGKRTPGRQSLLRLRKHFRIPIKTWFEDVEGADNAA